MKVGNYLNVALFSMLGLLVHQDAAGHTGGDDNGFFRLIQTSVYTRPFSPTLEDNNRQDLWGLERNEALGLVYGGATFGNSFAQRAGHAYAGKRLEISPYPVNMKLTDGLLRGSRG